MYPSCHQHFPLIVSTVLAASLSPYLILSYKNTCPMPVTSTISCGINHHIKNKQSQGCCSMRDRNMMTPPHPVMVHSIQSLIYYTLTNFVKQLCVCVYIQQYMKCVPSLKTFSSALPHNLRLWPCNNP